MDQLNDLVRILGVTAFNNPRAVMRWLNVLSHWLAFLLPFFQVVFLFLTNHATPKRIAKLILAWILIHFLLEANLHIRFGLYRPIDEDWQTIRTVHDTVTKKTNAADLYDFLKIQRDASVEDIKAARDRMTQWVHEEKADNKKGNLKDRLALITQTVSTLVKPRQRELYDQSINDGYYEEPPRLLFRGVIFWTIVICGVAVRLIYY